MTGDERRGGHPCGSRSPTEPGYEFREAEFLRKIKQLRLLWTSGGRNTAAASPTAAVEVTGGQEGPPLVRFGADESRSVESPTDGHPSSEDLRLPKLQLLSRSWIIRLLEASSTGSTNPFMSVEALEKMMEDPAVQKMVYPYLPEEMSNPTSFKWMLHNSYYLEEKTVNEGGKYSGQDAKAVMVQILRVITYCHLQGVVHRYLKPEIGPLVGSMDKLE
ncbi:hypothetical protein L1887_14859 [Cichorium endivia]|nr:hypothetical protein L1887_14859 [Cichorium endivia]